MLDLDRNIKKSISHPLPFFTPPFVFIIPFFVIVCGRGMGGDSPRLPLLKRGLALYLRRDVFFLISIDNLCPKAAMVGLHINWMPTSSTYPFLFSIVHSPGCPHFPPTLYAYCGRYFPIYWRKLVNLFSIICFFMSFYSPFFLFKEVLPIGRGNLSFSFLLSNWNRINISC